MYLEAFVEDVGSGYRLKVYETDPGLICVQYQELKNGLWGQSSDVISFGAIFANEICEAIMAVASKVDA